MITQILREMSVIAALCEALGYEDLGDLSDLITDDEKRRLIAIAETVEDTDEAHEIAEDVGRTLIREAIDRLLALEVTPSAAETSEAETGA